MPQNARPTNALPESAFASGQTERRSRFHLIPMRARNPHEPARAASTLELFFDLVFVVAISAAGGQLHHALTEGHIVEGVATFVVTFFCIWWAWMNFTWFATSFDTDDWLYRVMTIVQMAGVLTLAAGIEAVFTEHSFTIVLIGYIIMRIAMVGQWLRASMAPGPLKTTTRIYAVGITVVQLLWVVWYFLLSHSHGAAPWIGFVVLLLAEIAVPVIAEAKVRTSWHAHHITERYGLFTLIVLGESLLASFNAVAGALHAHTDLVPLLGVAALTLTVTAGLWWIYFWAPHARSITTFSLSLRYGYTHFVIFAAAAAFSAGVEVIIDVLSHASHLSFAGATVAATTPVGLFILCIWFIVIRDHAPRAVNIAVPLGAVLILLDPLVPFQGFITIAVIIGIVAVLVVNEPLPEKESGSPAALGSVGS